MGSWLDVEEEESEGFAEDWEGVSDPGATK